MPLTPVDPSRAAEVARLLAELQAAAVADDWVRWDAASFRLWIAVRTAPQTAPVGT